MDNQPTPSTQVNLLVELATNVANKQAQPELLEPVLTQRLEIIVSSREEFESKAEAMGEGFTIPNAPLIERVQEYYDAYEQALRTMLVYFESKNASVLHEGSRALIEITAPMIEAVQEYVRTLVTFGPSPYPLLNAARNTLKAVLEKGAPPEALGALVDDAVAHNTTAIGEIDASPYGKQEGYQAKRAAFEALTTAVKGLQPVASLEEIEQATAPVQLALESMTAADEKIFTENTALAPTAMPAANVLINTARGVINGVYTLETLEESLQWYRSYVEAIEEQFDAAVEGETDSVVVLEELPKTREIIDEHDEVIAELTEAMEDFTSETVEPILADLIDIVERLHDSSQIYMEVAKREGKAICVVCGHPNPPHNRSCEACGQKLPQFVDPNLYARSTFEMEERVGLGGADEEADGVVTENTLRLFEACYAFYEQRISEEDFRKVINWSRSTVETTDRAMAAMGDKELTATQLEKMTEEEIEAFEANRKLFLDSRQVLIDGMDDWSEGLDYLENYIETRHRPTIELGIQRIWVGSQKLYQVHKVGEIAERALGDLEAEERAKAAAAAASGASKPKDPHAEQQLENGLEEEDESPQTDPDLL